MTAVEASSSIALRSAIRDKITQTVVELLEYSLLPAPTTIVRFMLTL